MNVYEIFFSPTGGTQKCADLLASALGDNVIPVDLTLPGAALPTLTAEDVAVLAIPSYGGRVPSLAAERLSKLSGQGARAVLLCVYGNRAYEDTLVELQDIAAQADFRVVAAVAAVAEHSIARQFAAGRPDTEDAARLAAFGAQIAEKLKAGTETLPSIPGNRPYKKTSGSGLVPKPTAACTACGSCARQCPAQAIDPRDPKSVDSKACISCMRCVAVCPQQARKVNGVMLGAVGLALKKVCSGRKEADLFL